MDRYTEIMERTQWFQDSRLGMFIHFGLYSIPARGEWIRSAEKMGMDEYRKFFSEFNPDRLNMDEWMSLAKRSGAEYVVLTTKHHDGFCLFDSDLTDYKVTETPFGRDIIAEYVRTARKYGLKVGLYYSLVDWHHDGYPVYGDRQHPHRDDEAWADVPRDWNSYITYMHGQVRELCTNYGEIDLLWFDFSYWDMKGDRWKAGELVSLIRSLQPGIVINNRLGGTMWAEHPEDYAGDFAGPEQMIPRKGIRDYEGRPLPWESCITLNDSWGYRGTDTNWKSPDLVVQSLINCVSKGGNLLINIGPDARGQVPKEAVDILHTVGDWMELNQDAIKGCGESGFDVPEWGYFTRRGRDLYAHILRPTVGHLCLPGLENKIESIRLLRDGSEMPFGVYWNSDAQVEVFGESGDIYFNFGLPLHRTFSPPDPLSTAAHIRLKDPSV